jgi:hypothetical protein
MTHVGNCISVGIEGRRVGHAVDTAGHWKIVLGNVSVCVPASEGIASAGEPGESV